MIYQGNARKTRLILRSSHAGMRSLRKLGCDRTKGALPRMKSVLSAKAVR
jgi:hypothetical protein